MADDKGAILMRLRRAEGQIRGIANMVDADKNRVDILTQVSAVQAAVDKVALQLLHDHARDCMASVTHPKDQQLKADELTQAVRRIIGR